MCDHWWVRYRVNGVSDGDDGDIVNIELIVPVSVCIKCKTVDLVVYRPNNNQYPNNGVHFVGQLNKVD